MTSTAPGAARGIRLGPGWAMVLIVLVAALTRLPGLGRFPPAIHQDELSRGYDAWALAETGADRHGARWPFFLESLGTGDYTGALSTYLTIPFVLILGPTVEAMRLPDAVLGVISVWLVFAWLRRPLGETGGVVAALFLATDPWHITLCRTAHESGFAPFFLILAMLGLDRSGLVALAEGGDSRLLRPARGLDATAGGDAAHCTAEGGCATLPRTAEGGCATGPRTDEGVCAAGWAVLAGVALAFHAWVYPAPRLFTPLFLAAILLIALPGYVRGAGRARGPKVLLGLAAGLIVGGVPLWWTALSHPEQLAARAKETLLDWSPGALGETIPRFLANYAANLSPGYWFMQSDEMSGASIPGVGQHLPVFAPLVALGIVLTIRGARQQPFARLLLAWLLLYPLPAAICGDWNPHIMRTVAGVPLFAVFAGLGGAWLSARACALPASACRALTGAALLALATNLAFCAERYTGPFPAMAETVYQTPLWRAMQFAAAHSSDADFVLVTNRSNSPYLYAALAQPIAPVEFRRDPPVMTVGIRGFHHVVRLGKYFFAAGTAPEAQDVFAREWAKLRRPATGLVVERAGKWPGGEVLASFPCGDGSDPERNLEVRRWRLE